MAFDIEHLAICQHSPVMVTSLGIECGKVVLDDGHLVMLLPKAALPDSERPLQDWFRFGDPVLRKQQGTKDGEVAGGASRRRSFDPRTQLQPLADMLFTFIEPPFRMGQSSKIVKQVSHPRIMWIERLLAQAESPFIGCGSLPEAASVFEHDAQTVERCSEQHRIGGLDSFCELHRSPDVLFRLGKMPEEA